jgi:hypothetical protein
VRRRSAVVALGLSAALAGRRAHTAWPDLEHPLAVVDISVPGPAAWVEATFEPSRRRRIVPARVWSVLRARGLLVGTPAREIVDAAARGLGRPLVHPRLAAWSGSGSHSAKVTCFLFEAGAETPTVVVKVGTERLRQEVEAVEALRRRPELAELVAALPERPLWSGATASGLAVAEAVDPLAKATGRTAAEQPLLWLTAFQAATARPSRWDANDAGRALATVERAWRAGRPATATETADRVRALLASLEGAAVPVCAVHGDFWPGNVAVLDGEMRVFDWEWSQPDGRPFFDHWTWELGPLRIAAERDAQGLMERLELALRHVERRLAGAAIDPAFGLATIAPSLAELAFRRRWTLGEPDGREPGSARLMAAVELLLERRA